LKTDQAGRQIGNQVLYERIVEAPPHPGGKKKPSFFKETTTFSFDRELKISHIELTAEKINTYPLRK
jgi:hypothetical protein